MKSNITSTKCIETARYSNEAYFVGEYFLYFRKIHLFVAYHYHYLLNIMSRVYITKAKILQFYLRFTNTTMSTKL